jgi:hypothetical protein
VKRSNHVPAATTAGNGLRTSALLLLALVGICSLLLGGASATLAVDVPAPGSPAAEEDIFNGLRAAIESGNPQQSEARVNSALTDAAAAEDLPHRNLDRSEALELMQRVFDSELQAPQASSMNSKSTDSSRPMLP